MQLHMGLPSGLLALTRMDLDTDRDEAEVPMTDPPEPSPTVRRLRLGIRMRRLRLRAGRTMAEAADHVARTGSSISRIETGQVTVSRRVLDKLCELYDARPEERAALRMLAAEARQRGWWHPYGGVLPPGLDLQLGLETEATALWSYEPGAIPWFLRTEPYALELLRAGPRPADGERLESLLIVDRERRKRLEGQGAPAVRVVLHEGVLRQAVGGAAVMREQRDHLLRASHDDAVELRILPFAAGAHPAMGGGGFTLLSVPLGDEVAYDVVCVPHLAGVLHLDRPADVELHREVFDRLRRTALGPDASRSLIERSAG
jgi:transcriptional regulator with XRE-family HTH domain